MFDLIEKRLQAIRLHGDASLLCNSTIGLEKESLRVASSGGMADTPHPGAWGSALTHPWLTTDYSEALTEFVTPPCDNAAEALDYLADLQSYAYSRLDDEMLWATSMPCVLAGDENIPIARYGDSNLGQMKHVYRVGLGHRYGRVMQVIAGVHFNWSLPESFWPMYRKLESASGTDEQMRDTEYMGLVRNIQRIGWIIPYLFGASPSVCKSFFAEGKSDLPLFDEHTYFEPHATSLRMGDIGYQNSKEEGLGIKACYDSVEDYAESLLDAISTPAELWQRIGVKVDGEYRQLNANILQIENEYYNSVRPKQILDGLESPAIALHKRGIRYVELRSLDVNAYHPLGVDETQLRFLEAFMLCCLLSESEVLSQDEQAEVNENLLAVAHRGREPGLKLQRRGGQVSLHEWGTQILQSMLPICQLLDEQNGGMIYEDALDDQLTKMRHPDTTPSARMLREMEDRGEGFYQFANRLSVQHHRYFSMRELNEERTAYFDKTVRDSHQQQQAVEQDDGISFDQFLSDYFAGIIASRPPKRGAE